MLQNCSAVSFFCLCLFVFFIEGCTDNLNQALAQPTGYKYFMLTRNSSGFYRNGTPIDPGDVAIYSYSFRRSDLEKIDPNMELAVKKFIEMRKAEPPECRRGFHVIKLGAEEYGGVSANIECDKK